MTEATKAEAALRRIDPQARIDPQTVPGWGVDANPRNDPTYPMRNRAADDGPGMNWERPSLQGTDVEVLQSIEHVRRPAAFGTSTPPRGLSGMIRRWAFRYSESQWAHWLLLIGGDRVNMVEGLFGDLMRGRIPNLFAEMGLGTELKHRRNHFLISTAATVAGVAVLAVVVAKLLDD